MTRKKVIVKGNGNVANFKKRWDDWRSILDALVGRLSSGIFVCPEAREINFDEQLLSIHVDLPYPICIYGIPQKLQNRRSDNLAIFIDGKYELEKGVDVGEDLRRVKSTIAFYKAKGNGNIRLELIDAYHFDLFDSPPLNHAPHSVFHAQRDIICGIAEPRFESALGARSELGGVTLTATTDSNKSKLFQFADFRIPTPQMDILNLGAVMAADRLVGCNDGVGWNYFKQLLKTIHGNGGDLMHQIKLPDQHDAGIFIHPRKKLADWYSAVS